MTFINETDFIGRTVIMMTDNLTGSDFLTYLLIFLVLILLTQLFKLPLELVVAFTLPLGLVLSVGFASFIPIMSVVVLLTATQLARKLMSA